MSQLTLSTTSWTSQRLFVFAAVGSAVGLGNLWKFPYITGENGGGAFVLVYLLCILGIGLPLLIAEITLGKSGQASPPQAMTKLAAQSGGSRWWSILGFNGLMAGLLILSLYTVIAGWGAAYLADSLLGSFNGITATESQAKFASLVSSPWTLIFWHTLLAALTIIIVAKGIRSGLEKAISIMVPGLVIILLLLLGYVILSSGAFMQSVNFLFNPDFSKLSWNAVLVALGHAFFTLSLGFGTMMVYGSYMPKNYAIIRTSLWIVAADTAIALIAGLVIFSIVFGNGLEVASGPGLLFETLPIAFGQMTGGWIIAPLFFAMVVLAALSSSISMLEPTISWMEQKWGWCRTKAAWLIGGVTWLIGLGTVFSFNIWSNVHFLGDRNFFNTLDYITSNIQLPLAGLFTALFVGWVWTKQTRDKEMGITPKWSGLFTLLVKWVAPVLVSIVFVLNVF